MITSVDEDSRHRDLPSLQNKIDVEKQQIGTRRDADIDRRAKKLEETRCTEAEGETAQAKKKLRDTAEKEWTSCARTPTVRSTVSSRCGTGSRTQGQRPRR